MADDRIIRSIVEKCDFLYDDALLSDEEIIEKYLLFFAGQFDPTERSVSFAFHTGSLCFDVVSVAALIIGCLAYEYSSNDEILAELQTDDMVLYKGERYRWRGIEKKSFKIGEPQTEYIILKQDAKGKNGSNLTYIPYERHKHLVKPYLGTSSITDGRGIRKDRTNRDDFLSYILEIDLADVPATLDISAVVVADKNRFIDICRHLKIRYDGNKTVGLMDIVPVSYYTGTGEQFQIGKNASKAEAVIKVTEKISVARDMVLDKSGNRVIGLLVTNAGTLSSGQAELNDLLRRKTLKFAYVISPYKPDFCEQAIEQHESAKVFACTKEMLSGSYYTVKSSNKLTEELNRQISNILVNEIHTVKVEGPWNWEQYKKLKEKLYSVRLSDWSGEDRDSFIRSAMALINLFSTSFFSMNRMDNIVAASKINATVVSPELKITELLDIATDTVFMRDQCLEIVSMLLEMYSALHEYSPKETALISFLEDHRDAKTLIVVPKAYYADIFADAFQSEFENVTCVTANRFDKHEKYDIVIAIGDYVGRKFDALQCYSAPQVTVFLYDFEEKTFSFRKRKAAKFERKLNARIKGLEGDEYIKAIDTADSDDSEITEHTMREFADLDDFVNSMGMFDIRKLTELSGSSEDRNGTAEVKYIGSFITGEQILFSKFYSAVVLDQSKNTVVEKSPEKLLPGDILVFTKRNEYTSNIVDQIFEHLICTKRLDERVLDAAKKAPHWKTALRKYKDSNNLTYKAIANELKKHGSSLQEVTVRQWLIEESQIIGPRDARTMIMIAEVTQDSLLLSEPENYFEACRIVRQYRRRILSLIAQAINEKLINKQPAQGSVFEVVYENVGKLAETMELESISELDDIAVVNNGMVNRPISESEVLL